MSGNEDDAETTGDEVETEGDEVDAEMAIKEEDAETKGGEVGAEETDDETSAASDCGSPWVMPCFDRSRCVAPDGTQVGEKIEMMVPSF